MLEPTNSSLNSAPRPASGAGGDLVQQLCKTLERRLRAGESLRCEVLLAQHPELAADPELALDLIYTEYATRCELGEEPAASEFTSRFPQWQAQLDEQFQLDELLDAEAESRTQSGDDSEQSSRCLGTREAGGRFRVLSLLARGGIGQILRAMDTELNREVAVKEILPKLVGAVDVRERFLREAEITGRLEHPGVVPVYGLDRDAQGRPFYAMRLVRGQCFLEAIEEFHANAEHGRRFHSIEFQKLLRRFLSVCETIAYAHSRGVIHRDLKPQNILLGPFGETLVVDWGLAKVTDPIRATDPTNPPVARAHIEPLEADDFEVTSPTGDNAPRSSAANWSVELTQPAGALIGTPAFMSPEQARGEAQLIGPASDVYSLGATLHTLLTGRNRFSDSDLHDTLRQVIAGEFARPREWNRAIPRSLEAICLKAMALLPENRYASASDLAGDVEHYLADEPVSAARESIAARLSRWGRRNRRIAVAGLVALLLITAISTLAAFRINGERLRADGERIEAVRQRFEADRQRIEADRERIEANRQRVDANRRTARLAFDRGFALTKDHEYGEGLLWFARALEHAPKDGSAMRRVILSNMDATRHYLLQRRAAFTHNVNLRMVFSPDGNRLLTTARGAEARLWDVESGAVLSEHKLLSTGVIAVQIAADGTVLVALVTGRTVSVQRLSAAKEGQAEPTVAMVHGDSIACATFSPDGNILATGSRKGGSSKIWLWRVSDGELLGAIDHPASVQQIAFRPKTTEIATIGSDGRVRSWETTKRAQTHEVQTPVREVKVVSRSVKTIAFTPDGKRMLAGDSSGSISEWDMDTGQRLPDGPRQSGEVTAIAVGSDGQTVAAAWDTGAARIWNLDSRAPFCKLLRLDRFSKQMAFRPGTRQLLIRTETQTAVLWEVPNPSHLAPVLGQRQVISSAFSADGKKAITGNAVSVTSARLRDTATGKAFGSAMRHDGKVNQLAFRPDSAVVLTASHDGTARLWNATNGNKHGQVMDHRASTGVGVQVQAAAFGPDGRFVLTGDNKGQIRIWNGDTGEPVNVAFEKATGSSGSVVSVCFSSGGECVVAGFTSGHVGLWEAGSGKLLWSARHRAVVRSVAISPDGRVVLSAGNDETARFWDARDGKQIGPELAHRGEVFVAAFSPDGRLAVTGGFDATVRFWEVPSGLPVGVPMRHDGVVATVAFSRDGTRLLTAGTRDRTARLWDVATCLPLSPPLEHTDDVFSVAIHPAGHVALTGRFWHLPSPLPDDPKLVEFWTKLATQRNLTSGDNVEWLAPDVLASLTAQFHARTGQAWSAWADSARESSNRAAIEAHAASLRAK